MAYSSRGRSITEVIVAVIFIGFLTGFVAVLCIGNYFRARRAMERQKQTRLAKLAGVASGLGGATTNNISPRSQLSSSSGASQQQQQQHQQHTDEHQHLLNCRTDRHQLGRHRKVANKDSIMEGTDSLLFQVNDEPVLRAV